MRPYTHVYKAGLIKINIRVSTGLEVDVKEWNKSLASAKALTAFRSGKGKDLFIKLDAIMYTIDSLTSEGVTLTPDLVKRADTWNSFR